MPDHDNGGDRLRREFERQAPQFDLHGSLPGKVSALVHRRQRNRRILAVGAAVAVVAAVAIPLSALRSNPPGHTITPATTPTSSVTTAPSVPPATTTPTSAVALPPLSCATSDLWTTPVGTAFSTAATLGDVTVTLTGTTALEFSSQPELLTPELAVTVGGSHFSEAVTAPTTAPGQKGGAVDPWSLTPVTSNTGESNSDALCLARFPGQSLPTVMLGLTTGYAHCCTYVRAIPVSPAGLGPAVDDDLADAGVALKPDGDDAMIVTADTYFAYQFTSFAYSGMPLTLLQFNGHRFVDITSQRSDLLTADAAQWWQSYTANPGNGLGLLAAWVADECALGLSGSAWTTVTQLETAGKLTGPLGAEGNAYITTLKTFLAKQGYDC